MIEITQSEEETEDGFGFSTGIYICAAYRLAVSLTSSLKRLQRTPTLLLFLFV